MPHPLSWLARIGLLLGLSAGGAGCAHSPPEPPTTAAPTVTVSYPLQREVTDYAEYTGRTAAVESLEVRARVSGYLNKIYYLEGSEVGHGDMLYEIDPRPYQAALDQVEAQVHLQEAQLQYLQAVYRRNNRLYEKSQAVDLETLQQSLAQRDTTRAQLAAAQANVAQARLNLDWTTVRSPINGRIGRALVTRGNLVVADQTLLTTVASQDPMYAFFDMDEPTVLHVQELIRTGKIDVVHVEGVQIDPAYTAAVAGLRASASPQAPLLAAAMLLLGRNGPRWPVFLGLASEKGFPHAGYVNFVNNQVNPGTGTLQIRGVFPNPLPELGPRLLAPGLFVHMRVLTSPPHRALLVVQDAVGTDQNLKFVYVVNDQDQVERRTVTLGALHEGLQAIAAGIQPRERVIINGLQHVHPDVKVTPKLVPMPALAQPPVQGSTAAAKS